MDTTEKEIFKDIEWTDGRYQISNFGRVWSTHTNIFLSQKITNDGYNNVCLYLGDNRKKYERVHRLVALAFCEKPEGCTIVNHLDLNKTNNHYSNLEWTTAKGNTAHYYNSIGKTTRNKNEYELSEEGKANLLKIQEKATAAARIVNTYHITAMKNDEVIGVFIGKEEAARALGINPKTIYNCINENRTTRNGISFTVVKGGDDANAAKNQN